jgi:lysophospholipase L1-like esterase
LTESWVATWTAAQQPADTSDLPGFLAGGTLRQSVRVSAGGRQLRLRLSNAFGESDLTIALAGLALPAGGRAGSHAIRPGTSALVTFGGQPAVRIPAGAQALSDPLDFAVDAGAVLSVTICTGAGRGPRGVTSHPGSRTTSYVLEGNHVLDEEMAGAVRVDHWYFLAGIDVLTAASGAAVMIGDSLTDGRGSTTNGNDRWPDQLFTRLRSRQDSAGIAIVNQGVGGNRVLRDGLGPHVLARLDRDVLAVSGARWLVVFAGVNDIGAADATEAAQRQITAGLIAAYGQIVTRARAQGIRVYGATLTPFGGHVSYDDPAGYREASRQAVNQWIRAGGGFDAVIDFDRAVRDQGSPRRLVAPADCGDHLHLNPEGYRALAGAVPARLFRRGRQALRPD